jgi:F-type H+-transporting ATPase subunit delta
VSMQGISRGSLADARERLDTVLRGTGVDGLAVAEDLFSVTGLLDREISLRRVLSDPSAAGDRKVELARSLLGGQIGDAAFDLFTGLVRSRWSRPRDLPDAVEILAVQSAVAAAEREGYLDEFEDNLFRFGRIVAGDASLRGVLVDRTVSAERKRELVRSLVEGKTRPITQRLITQVVTQPRGRSLERGLEEYAAHAAARRQRVVGVVRSAVPLTDEQKTRLQAALRRIYGRDVSTNVIVDPEVTGGISVQVGDEIIDGTVLSKLDEARRRLAS